MRILVVEDSHASMIIISKMLKSMIPNAEITHAQNGKDALLQISEKQFELMVLDLGLPDIGGLHILEMIKNFPIDYPIISITDESSQSSLMDSLTLGAVDYLTKPLMKTQFNQVLSKHINLKKDDKKNKVLIVDDEAINHKVLSKILSKEDYQFDIATNGFEAIHSVKNNNYKCVLMDIRMPYMDGIEATQHIKKIQPNLPIIFVTAEPLEIVHDKCINVGGKYVLPKPINKKILLSSVEESVLEYKEKTKSGSEECLD